MNDFAIQSQGDTYLFLVQFQWNPIVNFSVNESVGEMTWHHSHSPKYYHLLEVIHRFWWNHVLFGILLLPAVPNSNWLCHRSMSVDRRLEWPPCPIWPTLHPAKRQKWNKRQNWISKQTIPLKFIKQINYLRNSLSTGSVCLTFTQSTSELTHQLNIQLF